MRIRILGLPVDTLDKQETCNLIFNKISQGSGGVQTSINTFKLKLYHENSEVKSAIEGSDICSPDGASIVLAARLLNSSRIRRVPGIDLFEELIEKCADNGTSIYLLGSTDYALLKVQSELSNRHPQLTIAGARNGFWQTNETDEVIQDIRRSGAKICFIALPTPLKEVWALEHKEFLNGIFLVGVGGSFEVIGGLLKRAPKWIQNIGLEWLYRLSKEPKRLFKRYFLANSFFAGRLILGLIKRMDR